jgi:hypothetical protein
MTTPTVTQEALPGVLLPERAITAAAVAFCGSPNGQACTRCTSRVAAALLAGLEAIDPELVSADHVLIVDADRWTIKHPLACRPNLDDCPVHDAVSDALGDWSPLVAGRYTAALGPDGLLLIDGTPLYDDPDDDSDSEGDQQ